MATCIHLQVVQISCSGAQASALLGAKSSEGGTVARVAVPQFQGLRQVSLCKHQGPSVRQAASKGGRLGLVSAFFNPQDDPVLKEAIKEPIAFFGGLFAGILRLDLNEEPLKDWVAKTAEAAGVVLEDDKKEDNEGPVDIAIE
eukprot:jgi/Mesen1/4254/ME000022S03548